MKKRLFIWLPIVLLLFLVIIVPPIRSYYPPQQELYYNKYTKIYYVEGETFSECYTGRECYFIPEADGEWFQISIPPEYDFPYLLGHRYTLKPDKDEWVIFDTIRDVPKEDYVLFHGTKEESLERWKNNGWPDVTIAKLDEIKKKFPQTIRSRFFEAIWIVGFIKEIVAIIAKRYWFIVLPTTVLISGFFLMRKCIKANK